MNINASIAGILYSVLVKVGDVIVEGQEVAIIESMKMQIPIVAGVSGTVTQIKLKDGNFVNEGDIIMTLA
ncbi:MAG: biotin/lipoyl-containing protein [Bacillus sp. (in: firmicutes)]